MCWFYRRTLTHLFPEVDNAETTVLKTKPDQNVFEPFE